MDATVIESAYALPPEESKILLIQRPDGSRREENTPTAIKLISRQQRQGLFTRPRPRQLIFMMERFWLPF